MTDLAIEPVTQFTLNHDDPHSQLALHRVFGAAMEAYGIRYHYARHHEEQPEVTAHEEALFAAITVAGRAYAAAALNQAAEILIGKVDEETALALGDTAAALDLAVVEDLTGANGTGEIDTSPDVSVYRRAEGWTLSGSQIAEACISDYRRQQEGRPPCTDTAVWKVVQRGDMHLSIGFYCDADLPDEHRHLATTA